MTHLAFYNEIDPYAAAWLRNLIAVQCAETFIRSACEAHVLMEILQ